MFLPQKIKIKKKGQKETLEVTDMFVTLTVEMVSQVCVYLQTHRVDMLNVYSFL